MTFAKYKSITEEYIENRDRVFHTLSLVSDTANLLEKLKYFNKENVLILSQIGEVTFRLFALMNKLRIELNNDPIDLEDMKVHTDELDTKFVISENDLIQSIIMENGIICNIITENMKYDVEELNESDMIRMKNSLYSYILYLLILCCKFNFSIDKVLDFNHKRLKSLSKEMKVKKIKEGE